jgi:hypothetical protein
VANQTFVIKNPKNSRIAALAIDGAKQFGIDRYKKIITQKRAKNEWPKETDESQLFLRQGGRESKRQISTVRSEYLKIPFSLVDIRKSSDEVYNAAKEAYDFLKVNGPFKTGAYRASVEVISDAGTGLGSLKKAIETGTWREGDQVRIFSAVPYAASVEAINFTRRGGLGYTYAAYQLLKGKYSGKISIQHVYMQSSNLGVSYPGIKGVQIPVIIIAAAGDLKNKDTRPGTNVKRRRAKARRAAKGRS